MRISVSPYSAISSVCIFAIAILIVFLLRRQIGFLRKYCVSVLLFASVLALFRLVLPLDFSFSIVIESKKFIPWVQALIRNLFQAYPWLKPLLIAIWTVIVAGILMRDAYLFWRFYLDCSRYAVAPEPRVNEIAERLSVKCPILVSPEVDDPFVVGFFRHKIFLPDQELSDREIELILMHEGQHIRAHDPLIKLCWGVLSAFLLIPRLFLKEVDSLLEFRCDAAVTEPMSKAERLEYSEMLTKMAKQSINRCNRTNRYRPVLNRSGAVNSENVLKQRLDVLMYHAKKGTEPKRTSHVVKAALVAVFLATYLIILQPSIDVPVNKENPQMRLASGERATSDEIVKEIKNECIVKIDGKYYLFSEGRQGVELSSDEMFSEAYKDYIVLEEYIP